MSAKRINRRDFVKTSLSALAVSSIPAPFAFSQTTIRFRPEWREFRASPNYSSFIDAIRIMRANTNGNDRSSLRYWSNSHINYCPHDVAYFLAWHRGYLFYFEEQLRIVSGNSNLVLPYWDYYRYPTIPPEFTDPASGNPLYVRRVNTNVYNALSLAPFGPTVWNFERGRSNAFEPQIESRPHNPVHNIIGGVMTTLESPMDPIFYLHHANIDRLWHAWAMPDGKGIPWVNSPYWTGSFTYGPNLTIRRSQCYHPNRVGTDYADVTPPSSLPPQADAGRIMRVQAQQGGGNGVGRPAAGDFPAIPARPIGANRRSLGGARGIALSERSVSVRVPLQAADAQSLQGIAAGGGSLQYKSAQIVLDDVRLLGAGRLGGYFYKLYLNMPEGSAGAAAQEKYLLGTVGPFEIASASHHGNGATLRFPATETVARAVSGAPRELTVSLVRVDGQNSPRGQVVSVGELRVEVSTEEPFDTTPLIRKPANEPYR
ncbi:hypothetical protein GCM10027343_31370 [Noviherbaspirillum agri]